MAKGRKKRLGEYSKTCRDKGKKAAGAMMMMVDNGDAATTCMASSHHSTTAAITSLGQTKTRVAPALFVSHARAHARPSHSPGFHQATYLPAVRAEKPLPMMPPHHNSFADRYTLDHRENCGEEVHVLCARKYAKKRRNDVGVFGVQGELQPKLAQHWPGAAPPQFAARGALDPRHLPHRAVHAPLRGDVRRCNRPSMSLADR